MPLYDAGRASAVWDGGGWQWTAIGTAASISKLVNGGHVAIWPAGLVPPPIAQLVLGGKGAVGALSLTASRLFWRETGGRRQPHKPN